MQDFPSKPLLQQQHRCLCDFRYTFTSGRTLDGCFRRTSTLHPRVICCLWASLLARQSHALHVQTATPSQTMPATSHTIPRPSVNRSFGKRLIAARSQENAPKMPSSSRSASGHGGRSRASVSLTGIDAWVPHRALCSMCDRTGCSIGRGGKKDDKH